MSVKVPIEKEELEDMYLNQKLNTYQIANIYGCCQATIWKRMKEFSIKARTPYELISHVPSKEELEKLYIAEKLSTWQIEKRFGFSRGTVFRKLKEYSLPTRSLAKSHFIHPRKDFSGNQIEAAYLIGFRIGDLRVRKPHKNSETISIECGTTIPAQLELIKLLFEKYVYVWVTKKNRQGANNIGANLPLSFDFLLSKIAPEWAFEKEDAFFSFLAGFTDAEGSIGIPANGAAAYQVGNYDKILLEKIKRTLKCYGIDSPKLYLGTRKGFVAKNGYVQNGDYWHLHISKKAHLYTLLVALKPYIKHPNKVPALKRAIQNIEERNRLYGN